MGKLGDMKEIVAYTTQQIIHLTTHTRQYGEAFKAQVEMHVVNALDAMLLGDKCLLKVQPGEPIFVLRAQDITAPDFVSAWASRASKRLGFDHLKVREAIECANEMREWLPRKYPD